MAKMPTRDITGKCQGECRDRVHEGEVNRQREINASAKKYNSPAERSPSWTSKRNDPAGSMGGRV